MLASRSPTFRLIFDEMIANGAWGSVNEALYLPDEDGDLGFSEPKEMCISTGESSDGQERDEDQGLGYNSYTQEADVYVDECKDENEGDHQHVNGILYSHGNIEAVWRSKLETDLNQSAHSHVAPELSERYDVDGSLPKLTLDLEGPDDGHVDELLYWLYTDNAPRWLASFTTSNYENILRNILLLNIVTPQVLQVCRDFEASIDPGSGLRGRMDQVLCQVPMTGCPETRE
ncbi:hypothetical protein BGX28_007281 [Mortierella sp. GBA30]|nr:hypothetical protein BGX28_007281 [Mortierella sp. GBA30]